RFLRWRPAKQYDMVCVNLTGVDLIPQPVPR
ncbi:hypothetical protein EE612_043701, partial [Oryza sativa]